MSTTLSKAAVLRLRIGILLFVLFWLPAYLLAPAIAAVLGDESAIVRITVAIMAIQTVLGLLGFWMAGTQVIKLLKHTPRKKLPKTVWHLFWSGQQE
jgi:hypothetical protein